VVPTHQAYGQRLALTIQQLQATSEADFFDHSEVEDFSDLVEFDEVDSGYEGGVPATPEEFDDLTQDDGADPAVDNYQG
jgi:hypothetical protein